MKAKRTNAGTYLLGAMLVCAGLFWQAVQPAPQQRNLDASENLITVEQLEFTI